MKQKVLPECKSQGAQATLFSQDLPLSFIKRDDQEAFLEEVAVLPPQLPACLSGLLPLSLFAGPFPSACPFHSDAAQCLARPELTKTSQLQPTDRFYLAHTVFFCI